jgi:hypothetical protein
LNSVELTSSQTIGRKTQEDLFFFALFSLKLLQQCLAICERHAWLKFVGPLVDLIVVKAFFFSIAFINLLLLNFSLKEKKDNRSQSRIAPDNTQEKSRHLINGTYFD